MLQCCGFVHLIVGQESSLSCVSSSLGTSIGWSIEAVVVDIRQSEALAVERESQDQLLLIESTVKPGFNRVFLLKMKQYSKLN
jgi:hypothetical protein